MRQAEAKRLQSLQQTAFKQIGELLPQAVVNGSIKQRLPNNLHLTIPGADNERLLLQLEAKGILASAGSACSASDEEPSHVLRAMGMSDEDARASLRLTMGRATTAEHMDWAIRTLAELV
jgi:cysteine desulfurase